jgi:deferrochelatase/peroxidase EfeB
MSAYETADSTPETTKLLNNFVFQDEVCPYSSHIRKTNLREKLDDQSKDPECFKVKMIRNGIPYGSDYKGHESEPPRRGLLFACYQGHIEHGFQHMQAAWSNNGDFPDDGVGHDPIIGQVKQAVDGENGFLTTHFLADKTRTTPETVTFKQLVTMKGGEYFFVPPISALKGVLATPVTTS